jgi:hypothetical protein
MVIDEERKYILTNYEQVKRGVKATDTDHATEFIDLDLKVVTEKPVRRATGTLSIKNHRRNSGFKLLKLLNFQTVLKTICLYLNRLKTGERF